MIRNIVALIGLTVVSAVITVCIGSARCKKWSSFSSWWDGEGVPIFILVWFGLGIVLIARGCLRNAS